MAIGSTFDVSPGDRFFQQRGYYTSGSLFKRFQSGIPQRLNGQSVPAADDQVAAAAKSEFSHPSAQPEILPVPEVQEPQQHIEPGAAGKQLNILA